MKNIVVVGGTKGIGKHLVGLLNDSKVYIVARNTADMGDDEKHTFIQADVTSQSIDMSLLPETIDGLVYCPGSINLKPFHRLSEEDFLNDWRVNVLGAVKVIQQLLPALKKAEHSAIILFSTVAVGTGMPFHSSIAAAKAAVEGLMRSLAAELAPQVRVNCIAPSLIQTSLADKLVNTPEKVEAGGKGTRCSALANPLTLPSWRHFC